MSVSLWILAGLAVFLGVVMVLEWRGERELKRQFRARRERLPAAQERALSEGIQARIRSLLR